MDWDYAKIGFKCGIEVHQQLDTSKLFCSCPSLIRDDPPDITVTRRMRAVAGETGIMDPAALHEFLKGRELSYEAYSDTNCLVELDEEPPHLINEKALEVALTVALMLDANPVSELQVMRKTVIDGSNTSGFQRTVLVAMDGCLKTSQGDVGIPLICIEEDAARIIEDDGELVRYRLDRLGIPLVEIATDPDLKSPAHAREVAEKLGLILRATGRVKRGLGTIRQDINVSITGGERIEVKGVQDLKSISKICENEVSRQVNLICIKNELKGKKYGLSADHTVVTDCFKGDSRPWIKKITKSGGSVYAIGLPDFSGILGRELMPDYRFGSELSQVARETAGVGGILHSDEESNRVVSTCVKKKLGLGGKDAWVGIVSDDEKRVGKAFKALVERIIASFKGVPKETRRPDGDKSAYMRPLPGSNRMYPETDEPPINTDELVGKIKGVLPKLPEEKLMEILKLGVGEELANQLVHSAHADAFISLSKKYSNIKPSVVAQTLVSSPKEALKRYGAPVDALSLDNFDDVLSLLDSGRASKDVVVELLTHLSKEPGKSAFDVLTEFDLGVVSGGELESIVIEEAEKAGVGAPVNVVLGRVMARVDGRAKPKEVLSIIGKRGH